MSAPIYQMPNESVDTSGEVGVEINPAALSGDARQILTPEVLVLVADLHRAFEPRRQELLQARREWQAHIDAGNLPEFPDRNSEAVQGDWRVGEIPQDLRCSDDDPLFEFIESHNVQIVPAVHAVQLFVTTDDGTGEGIILSYAKCPGWL